MMIVPTGTDAPIYHWPYATVGLIVLNVVLLFAVPQSDGSGAFDDDGNLVVGQVESAFDRYALTLGDGLHPVQWVTHNFLHDGAGHLLGNMVFLWAFGIVVEGKLGALKFLPAYLAIGAMHGAGTQLLLLRSGLDGHAVGASAEVFGLLAACMIWAPRNELSCIIIIPLGYRILVFQKEFYYTTVALWYIGEQILTLIIWGGLAGEPRITEMLHLSGVVWGSVIALLLLKLDWVDCEGWDLFSIWTKNRGLAKAWKARGDKLARDEDRLRDSLKTRKKQARAANQPEASPEERSAAATSRVLGLVDRGEVEPSLAAFAKASRSIPYWPSQPDLYAIIKALQARKADNESVPLMREHCRRFPAASDKLRLKLAQVLIRDRNRPLEALSVLGEIPEGSLAPDLEKVRRNLDRQATRMSEEGVLELEEDR